MQVSVLSHFKNVFENDNDNDDDDNDDGGSRCRIDDEDDKGPCKRSQHCWPTKRNNVGPNMLRAFAHHVVCCCVLLRLVGSWWMKFETGQTNNFQQVATTSNNTQHGVQTLATCWAQQCCERLHGP